MTTYLAFESLNERRIIKLVPGRWLDRWSGRWPVRWPSRWQSRWPGRSTGRSTCRWTGRWTGRGTAIGQAGGQEIWGGTKNNLISTTEQPSLHLQPHKTIFLVSFQAMLLFVLSKMPKITKCTFYKITRSRLYNFATFLQDQWQDTRQKYNELDLDWVATGNFKL